MKMLLHPGRFAPKSETQESDLALWVLVGFILPALNVLAIWWGYLKLKKREAVPNV